MAASRPNIVVVMADDHAAHAMGCYGAGSTRRRGSTDWPPRGMPDRLGVPGASAVAHPPQWELFDLERDPFELQSVHDDPGYAAVRRQLTLELARVQAEVGDRPWRADVSIDL